MWHEIQFFPKVTRQKKHQEHSCRLNKIKLKKLHNLNPICTEVGANLPPLSYFNIAPKLKEVLL